MSYTCCKQKLEAQERYFDRAHRAGVPGGRPNALGQNHGHESSQQLGVVKVPDVFEIKGGICDKALLYKHFFPLHFPILL